MDDSAREKIGEKVFLTILSSRRARQNDSKGTFARRQALKKSFWGLLHGDKEPKKV